MTLEPDPAAVLVHERLEQAVSSMRAPDVEVGWAALVAQLEAPIAPVVPLRPPARGRFVAFAVAAALMVAGSAFAAVSHVRDTPPHPIAPAVPSVHAPVTGPHAHAPFSGPPAEQRPSSHHDTPVGTKHDGPSGTGDAGGAPSPGGSGDGSSKPGDDPNDRDQGTGNDGQHNDHGGGNNGPEGTHPSTSGGSSHGGSSHGGSSHGGSSHGGSSHGGSSHGGSSHGGSDH
jgi:hypothetical protein